MSTCVYCGRIHDDPHEEGTYTLDSLCRCGHELREHRGDKLACAKCADRDEVCDEFQPQPVTPEW